MPLVHCAAVIVAGHWVGVIVLVLLVGPEGVSEIVLVFGIEHAAHAAEAVVGEEVKEPVLDDGAAHRTAELLLLVNRLREQERRRSVVQRLELAVGIQRVQRRIAQVVERSP